MGTHLSVEESTEVLTRDFDCSGAGGAGEADDVI